jgi:hypothetical protein
VLRLRDSSPASLSNSQDVPEAERFDHVRQDETFFFTRRPKTKELAKGRQGRRMITRDPRFDEYSPYASSTQAVSLPRSVEKRLQKLRAHDESARFKRSFVDDVVKRGTSAREKPRARTWSSAGEFFERTSFEAASPLHLEHPVILDFYDYY